MTRIKRRFERNTHKKLKEMGELLLGTFATVGLTVAPFAMPNAEAGTITRVGNSTNLMQNGKAEIYAGKAYNFKGGVGLNSFSKYKVDSGEIANMHFTTAATNGTSVNTLVNLVDSRIDIYGTVNALKNNKIDGNMYFISKEGMVVGNKGVINAGQLTVITPNKELRDDEKFPDSFGALESGKLALNKSGSIVVLGTINTAGGVKLQAPKVQLGGTAKIDDVQQSGKGTIRTGVDFNNLVNTKGLEVGNLDGSAVNAALEKDEKGNFRLSLIEVAGADGETKAQQLENHNGETNAGDAGVTIIAENAYANYTDETLKSIYSISGFSGHNEIRSEISLNSGSTIDALGSVKINANATNEANYDFADYWGFDVENWSAANLFDSGVYSVRAIVDANGTINGSKVDISASSKASFNNSATKGLNVATDIYSNFIKQKLANRNSYLSDGMNFLDSIDVALGFVNSKASVNVAKGASITTNSSDLSIKATNTTKVKLADTVQNVAYDETGKQQTYVSDVLNFVVDIADAVGEATVNVDGNLTSKGKLTLDASSTVDSAVKAAIARPLPVNPQPEMFSNSGNINLALALNMIDNKANVIIGEGAKVTAAKDIKLSSAANDSIDTTVKMAADENAFISVGLGFGFMDSNNKVEVNGTVKGGSIEVNAKEKLSKNNFYVSNSVGKDDLGLWEPFDDFTKTVVASKIFQYGLHPFKNLINGAVPGKDGKVKSFIDPDQWSNFGDVGANVGLVNEDISSKVIIGSKGSLTAEAKDVTINSITQTADSSFTIMGNVDNSSTQDKTVAMASVTVGIQNVDSNALIEIEGRDAEDGKATDAIFSKGSINLNAQSTYDWNRAMTQYNYWKGLLEKAKAAGIDVGKALTNAVEELKKADPGPNATPQQMYDYAIAYEKACAELRKTALRQDIQTWQDLLQDFPDYLKHPLNPTDYVQFYVANATAANIKKDKDDHDNPIEKQLDAKFGVAATVGINNLSNKANIVIGKNSKLNAATGDIKLNAKAARTLTSVYGKVMSSDGYLLPKLQNTSGAENGLGATVGVDSNDTMSTIAVAENAELTAKSIELKTDNYVNDIAFTYGGAHTVGTNFSSMLHVMGGNSNNIIAVDDEAKLTADKNAVILDGKNKIVATNLVGDVNTSALKSIGFGVGVMDYDVKNIIGITDNDRFTKNQEGQDVAVSSEVLDALAMNLSSGVLSAANFGNTENVFEGQVNASELTVKADTTGVQNVLAIAGVSAGTTQEDNGVPDGATINTELTRLIDEANVNPGWKLSAAGSLALTWGNNITSALVEGTDVNITPSTILVDGKEKTLGKVSVDAEDSSYIGAYSGGAALNKMSNVAVSNSEAGMAGAVGWNKFTKKTTAQIKDVAIRNALDISNKAYNSGAQVGIGIGIGASLGDKTERKGFDAAMSASVNTVDSKAYANILDTAIEGNIDVLPAVKNIAGTNEVQVAGGVSVEYSKASGALGVDVGILQGTNEVKANIGNTNSEKTWTALGAVQNYAYTKLNQVNGAISVGIANSDSSHFAGDAAVAYNKITNTVEANVNKANIAATSLDVQAFDGKIATTEADNPYVEQLKKETVVNYTNVKREYDDKGNVIGVEYEKTTKEVDFIDTDGGLIIKAATEDENGNNTLVNADTSEQGMGKLENNYDPTDKSDDAPTVEELHKGMYKTEKVTLENKGNVQVGFAISGALRSAAQSTGVVAGAGAVQNKFTNTFNSNISDSTITLAGTEAGDALRVDANSKTTMVGIAAGVAFDNMPEKGGVLVGSGVGENIKNTINAKIENSVINTANNKLEVTAKNEAKLVAIAGQVNISGGTNLGLGLAGINNKLDNTTGAYILGTSIVGSPTGTNVVVNAKNEQDSHAWAIGGGYTQEPEGFNLTGEGSFALNEGKNNTEAIIDQTEAKGASKILNAGDVSVTTEDDSYLHAIAGAVSVTKGNVAIGGAWAQNTIGAKDDRQHNIAAIRNTEIQHSVNDKNITVKAKDEANAYAVALAGSVSHSEKSDVAAEGTVAINKHFKDINAEFVNNVLDVSHEHKDGETWEGVLSDAQNKSQAALAKDSKNSKLEVKADTNEKNVTAADGFGVNINGEAAIGAGVAYNNSDVDTTAKIQNSAIAANNVRVLADNTNKILNVGFGASVDATLKSAKAFVGQIEFNLADNNIDNDVTAEIDASRVYAKDTVAVDAKGTEKLTNFIGGLGINFAGLKTSVAASAGAGVGLNDITSDVAAKVNNSNIDALGDGVGYNVKEYNEKANSDGEIDGGVDKNIKGLVVNAKGDHDLWNLVLDTGFLINGGGSAFQPNLNVAVSRNKIEGSTLAAVIDTDVNSSNNDISKANTNNNVYVNAYDDTDITDNNIGIVGNVSLNGSSFMMTAGAGASTNDITRTNTAVIEGKTKRVNVNADKMTIKALSHTDFYNADAGVAVGINPTGEGNLTNSDVISTIKSSYKTTAYGSNMDSYNNGMTIKADTIEKIRSKGIGVDLSVGKFNPKEFGLSVGVGVGVLTLQNGNRTEAGLVGSNITHGANADDIIKANTNTIVELTQAEANLVLAFYGAAINALFTNTDFDDYTGVTVAGTNIGNANGNKAKDITLEADNKIKGDFNNGSGYGALIGGGSGMENFSKVDTNTMVTVNNSKLYAAGDINVDAKEKIKLEALEVACGISGLHADVNKAHIYIGNEVEAKYVPIIDDFGEITQKPVFTTGNSISKINDANEAFNDEIKTATSKSLTSLTGETISSTKYDGAADEFALGGKGMEVTDLGGTKQAGSQGTKVKISNQSVLKSDKNVNILADRVVDAKLDVGQGSINLGGGTLAFAEIKDKRSVGVEINDSKIYGYNVEVRSNNSGTLDSTIVQAAIEGLDYHHVDSLIEMTGENAIKINDSEIYGDSMIWVYAKDAATAENHTVGAGLTLIKGGYLLNEINDFSNTGIEASGSTFNVSNVKENLDKIAAGTEIEAQNSTIINFKADKENYLNSRITLAEASVIGGQGAYSRAQQGKLDGNGKSINGLSYVNIKDADSTLLAEHVTMDATNNTSLRAVTTYAGLRLVDFYGGLFTYGNSYGGASVNVDAGNHLYADYLGLHASTDTLSNFEDKDKNHEYSIESHAQNVNAASALPIDITKAEAISKQTVGINLATTDIKGSKLKKENNGTLTAKTLAKLEANAAANGNMLAKTNGVSAVGLLAFGSNKSVTNAANKVEVNIAGATGKNVTKLESLDVKAVDKVKSMADSYGLEAVDLVNVKPFGAYTVNESNNVTKVNITGNISTNEKLSINARDNSELDFDVTSVKALSVIDTVGSAKLENTVNNSADVNINNANLTSGKEMAIAADTTVDIGKDADAFYSSVLGFSIIGVEADGSLEHTVNQKANVNINNSKLLSNDAMTINAYSDDYMYIYGRNKDGMDLFGATYLHLINKLTTDNKVFVDKDSTLEVLNPNKAMTLAAWDDMDLYANVAASVSGIAVGCISILDNNYTRNNTIDVAGNLKGYQDVNLYAGQVKDGYEGVLHAELSDLASNYSFGGGGKGVRAELNNNITQNNKVIVTSEGSVNSLRDTNLYAYRGHEYVATEALRYCGVSKNSADEVIYTSSKSSGKGSPVHNNEAIINGSVTAGKANNVILVIGANEDGTNKPQTILLSKDEWDHVQDKYDTPDKLVIYVKDESGTVQTGDGFTYDEATKTWKNGDFELSIDDYGNQLQKRLDEVKKLASEYSADRKSVAYLGYLAEISRLEALMESMGLVIKNEAGEILAGGISSLNVDSISVPNIIAGGGNINVHTDYLHGEGSLEAKGSPEVSVINNTNLMLKINDIDVQHPGGMLNYNDTVISGRNTDESGTGATKADAIKAKNVENNAKNTGTVQSVKAQNKSAAGIVNIKGNWNGRIRYQVAKEGEAPQTGTVNPIANILVKGNIHVDEGDLNIKSEANSVVIEGGALVARNINITAAKGGLYEGYTDSIVSIGGSVEEAYKDKVDKLVKDVSGKTTNEIVYDKETVDKEYASNYILGDNVYISAADININGTIQSGFGKYTLKINDDEATQKAIVNSIEHWQQTGSKPLEDFEVTTNSAYRIIEGGKVLDTDPTSSTYGTYIMTLGAYFNPSTKKIIVEDVSSNGGKIYLTGRISSTGSGKLNVADGAYDIDIENKLQNVTVGGQRVELGLQLGDLIVNDTEGLISIVDATTRKKTEIRRDGTTYYDINTDGGEIFINKTTGAAIDTYTPQAGLRYNWSFGDISGKVNYYRRVDKEKWWGWGNNKKEGSPEVREKINQKIKEWESNPQPDDHSEPTDKSPKTQGTYIGQIVMPEGSTDTFDDKAALGIIYNYKASQEEFPDGKDNTKVEEQKHGYLNFYTDYVVTWSKYQVESRTYNASAKADYGVAIKFAGNADGNSTVDVNSKSGVDIAGQIGNKKLYTTGTGDDAVLSEKGKVNIVSQNGDIIGQGGSIYGAEVKLLADNDIKNVKLVAGDNVNLTAITTNTNALNGVVDVEVKASAGAKGNVELVAVNGSIAQPALAYGGAGANYVSLKTAGSIDNTSTEAGFTSYIQGQRIDLTSTNDGVKVLLDSGNHALEGQLRSESINIQAEKDVYAEEKSGTMHIGTVYSEHGDVTLKSPGIVVDALEYAEDSGGDGVARQVEKWIELGLISDANTENSAIMRGEQKLADEYKAQVEEWFNEYKNATEEFKKTERYQELKETFGGFVSVADYLSHDGQYQAIQAQNLGMNKDALLYSIQESIMNRDPSSLPESSSKAANVRGNNVTIISADDVGIVDDEVKTIYLKEINGLRNPDKESQEYKDALEKLKTLSSADASTIKWHLEKKTESSGEEYISEDSYAEVSKRLALGIQTNTADGLIKIDTTNGANKNIFVEGRTDKNNSLINNKVINLDKLKTNEGNIFVSSLGEITNGHNIDKNGKVINTDAAIEGKDLILQAAGNIGSAEKVLTTQIDGYLSAVANGNLYLEQLGDKTFAIRNINARDNVFVQAEKDILMFEEKNDNPDVPVVVGYVNSTGGKAINIISTNGSIGANSGSDADLATTAIRIKNNNATPSKADAQNTTVSTLDTLSDDGATLQGKNIKTQDGVVGLAAAGNIAAEGVSVIYPAGVNKDNPKGEAAGCLNVRVDNVNEKDKLDNVYLFANGYLNLMDGSLDAEKTIELNSVMGLDVMANLTAQTVNGSTAGDINLLEDYIKADNVNLMAGQTINQAYDNEDTSKTQQIIEAANLKAEAVTGIDLGNRNNKLQNVALYNAGKDDENAYSVTLGNGGSKDLTITAIGKSEAAMADATLSVAEKRLAGNVQITNYDDIPDDTTTDNKVVVDGKAYTTGSINILDHESGIASTEASVVDAGGSVVINTENGEVATSGAINAAADVTINAGKSLNNSGDIESTVSGNVTLKSKEELTNSGNVTVRSGNIDLLAGVEPATIAQSTAVVNNSGDLAAAGNVTLKAYGSDRYGGNSAVTNTGAISSSGVIDMQAVAGSVTNKAQIKGYAAEATDEPVIPQSVMLEAKRNVFNGISADDVNTTVKAQQVTLKAEEGSVDNYMNVVSTTGDAEINAGSSILNKGHIVAEAKDAVIAAGTFVENSGNISAAKAANITAGNDITNDGSMKSGTGSEISAGGDIVNNGMVMASEGSVSITSTNGNIWNNDNADLVAGGGNVTISTKNTGDVVNKGDLAAKGDIILSSANGNIYNSDDFDEYEGHAAATNNVIFSAPNGRVSNTKNIHAQGIVSIDAKEGLAEFAYDIFAENQKNEETAISLSTKEAYLINRSQLIAEKGDIVLNADVEGTAGGSVINLSPGDIMALSGNVTITAGAAKNAENPEKIFIVNDLTSEVTDKAQLVTGESVNITEMLKATDDYAQFKEAHPNQDMIILTEHDYGKNTTKIYYLPNAYTNEASNVVEGDAGKKLLTEVDGVVDLFREGDVLNRGNIVALGKTTFVDDGFYVAQMDSTGKLIGGDITIVTKHGNLTNFDDLSKVYNRDTFEFNGKKYQLAEGSIKHSAKEGYYYNNMQLESGRDLWIESQGDNIIGESSGELITAGGTIHVISNEGSVINKGAVVSAGESVVFDGHSGVSNDGAITAGDDVDLKATEGNVVNNAGIVAGDEITLETSSGNVTNTGELVAGGDVTVTAQKDPKAYEGDTSSGNANIGGEVKADGDVTVNADINATVSGDVNSGMDVTVTAGNDATVSGNITNDESLVVVAGNDATVSGDVNSGKDVTVTAGNDATVSGNVTSGEDTAVSAGKDAIVSGDVNSGKEVSVEANENATVSGNVTSGEDTSVTAGKDATVSGDITSGKDATVTAGNDALLSGDIDAKGDVTVKAEKEVVSTGENIKAEGAVDISGVNGVTVDNAVNAGDKVAIESEAGSVTMNGTVEAGTEVEVTAKVDADVNGDVKAEDNAAVKADHDATVAGDVTSGKDVTVTAGNDATVSGDVNSGKDVAVKAEHDATVSGDVNSGKDVTVTAGNDATVSGNVTNDESLVVGAGNDATVSGDVNSGKEVSVEAKQNASVSGNVTSGEDTYVSAGNDASVSGDITSGKDATVTAGNDALLSGDIDAKGDVTVKAEKEVVSTGENIKAEGAVDISGVNGVTVDNAVNAGDKVAVESEAGSVTMNGTIEAGTEVDVTAKVDADVNAAVKAEDNVAVKAEHDATVAGDVTSGKDVTVTAGNDATVNGNVTNDESLVVGAGNDATVSGDVNSGKEVSVEAKQNATVSGNVTSGEDTAVSAGKDATVSGDITSGKDATVTAGNDASVSGDITGDKDVTVSAGNDASVSGDITSGNDASVSAVKDALLSGDVDAKGDVTISADNKVVDTGEKIAAGGEVDISGTNGVSVDSTITADKDINVDSSKGSVELNGDVASGDKVTVTGESIAIDGSVNAENHILIDAANGDLSINKNVQNTKAGIEMYAKDGSVNINQNITAGGDGLLRIYAELQEQEATEETAKAVVANGELKSVNGSVDVGVVNGDAYLAHVEAEEMATAGSTKGDIVIGDISAGTVVLYNKDADNSVAADKIVVKEHLVVQSADPELKKIEAAPGAQQIVIDITGTGGKIGGKIVVGDLDRDVDYKFGSLAVGVADVYTAGNIEIENLYLNGKETSEIIAKQDVDIDSLAVANKLFVSGHGYDTSVYGKVPSYDGSEAIYYQNGIGKMEGAKIKLDLEKLYFGKEDKQPAIDEVMKEIKSGMPIISGGKVKGMNLYIDNKHAQSSNGKLLHFDDYYMVYSQRYSAEDLSRYLADYKADADYRKLFVDPLTMFERYSLYELPGTEIVNGQIQNTFTSIILAGEDENK